MRGREEEEEKVVRGEMERKRRITCIIVRPRTGVRTSVIEMSIIAISGDRGFHFKLLQIKKNALAQINSKTSSIRHFHSMTHLYHNKHTLPS